MHKYGFSGLDPAGPLYYTQDESLTISKGSGDFVDIIHTNDGFILKVITPSLSSVVHKYLYLFEKI